jgi:glycosyltransferase involved in cell wall biosynthesis
MKFDQHPGGKPRVGIMLRHADAPGGITVFTEHVVRHLLAKADGISYHLLYQSPAQRKVFEDLPGNHVVLPSRSKLTWDQVTVPAYARRARLDVVFNGKLSVPLLCGSRTAFFLPGAEQFAVAHIFPWKDRMYNRLAMPLFCRKADAIITLTEQGRQDIVSLIGADRDKVHVIPPAAEPWHRPAPSERQEEVRARFRLTRRYILFVGGLTPLKNLGNLLRAFARLRDAEDIDLVLTGFRRWGYEDELTLVRELGLEDRVQEIGFVVGRDLAALYTAAECFVLPSWYEGFGIPILEAMACGCPVVASTGGCCADAAGGAALLAEPSSPESIADAIGRVLHEPDLRRTLVDKGLKRAAHFDWGHTGDMVRELLTSLI